MPSLWSHGYASEDDLEEFEELKLSYPLQNLPEMSSDISPSLCAFVTSCPGSSKEIFIGI